jgi:hypothetical protein
MQADKPAVFATPARLAGGSMDATDVAANAISIWRDVNVALAPIIGPAGVAALYRRSLYLTRTTSPCLANVFDALDAPGDYKALETVLAKQTSIDAMVVLISLLQTFHALLTRLIGESLTERLLRSVWDTPSSDHAVQDTSS